MNTFDPRDTEHIECDCVPDLGPSHCHLCSEKLGCPIAWAEAGLLNGHRAATKEAQDSPPSRN